ncbi:uncharacterized protein LOC121982215 isoform X1 [Zingiber officinale]|uniref:uncharacterized protein LOC121982215 isoform X1 n=1 Tax=Zingiber officinale TaxID=94328 RepID=UPI001C4D79AF|nr:uncharacterized protein LOC121982215 isoform X1 [Zingiber officinale]
MVAVLEMRLGSRVLFLLHRVSFQLSKMRLSSSNLSPQYHKKKWSNRVTSMTSSRSDLLIGRIRILQELQAMPVLIHIYGLVSFLVVKDEYARPQRPCQPVSEPIQRR